MATVRRRRFIPLTRVGLTLCIGAVAFGVFRAYIQLGVQAADLTGPDTLPADRDEFIRNTLREVAIGGGPASFILWAGAGLMVLGILRRLLFRRP